MTIPLGGDNTPYWDASSDSYQVAGYFIFPGSTQGGTPASVKALAFIISATEMAVKIYDATNAKTIAEKTGITNADTGILTDLGTLSNISSGAAVWEVQIKRTVGSGAQQVAIAGVMVEW